MELRHLRYFRAVAEELHFGRAAERLHMAQPPLSQQIRQLEEELGVTLLVRSTRRVELTPAGEAYLARVDAILDAVEVAGQQAQRIASGTQGALSIGCVGSATYSLLPRLVRVLRDELPDLDVSVRGEMLAPAQMSALMSGEIDLALLRPPVGGVDVVTETIRSDRLFVALPDGDPRTDDDSVAVSRLRDTEFIVHAGQGRSVMSGVVAAMCASAGFVPQIRHEVTETSTLVTLVAAGLGVAIVPEPTMALGIAGVQYRPLRPGSATIDLAVARLAAEPSPMIEQVLTVLRRVAREV
ncbi:LysR substrate-binding domain-containing protein [Gordonia sp. OPL2]|uniref:LysR substrate-binding domain-containing protein n=1 Tax=Gordonia sp. OPL2 TaxID=2486274 RepID=UPI001655CB8F|nr:LysR substrate-binding domain-containing protein [Gordonia sp. OPL2]ROZ89331.1 LysR family transcriptional regulator [Gordonia sp. OPL2]